MKKSLSIFILFLLPFCFLAKAQAYRNRIFEKNIKTLQVKVNRERYLLPVIELGGGDKIGISFDELSHESHNYGYKVVHCNADGTPSGIVSGEYLQGYSSAYITDIELSQTTTVLYTHYRLELPNDEMNFLISGNYAVIIYEDNKTDEPVATACFSIVEPKVKIEAAVRGNTDTELNRSKQQVDFDISPQGYEIKDPGSELKIIVRQNNRSDNEVRDLTPTFFANSQYRYINNRKLIFEGGSEYHSFDISSVYSAAEGVDAIRFERPHYRVYLYADKIKQSGIYLHNRDVNGKYAIHHQEARDDPDTEGDYLLVDFKLAAERQLTGNVYLGGEWNFNALDQNSLMRYDSVEKAYLKTLLLKQGGYNYQYWLLSDSSGKASCAPIDGSYWQTRNEYTIYVYHRPWGGRYDRLTGVKTVE